MSAGFCQNPESPVTTGDLAGGRQCWYSESTCYGGSKYCRYTTGLVPIAPPKAALRPTSCRATDLAPPKTGVCALQETTSIHHASHRRLFHSIVYTTTPPFLIKQTGLASMPMSLFRPMPF